MGRAGADGAGLYSGRHGPGAECAAGGFRGRGGRKTLELWRGFLALYDTGDHVFDDVAAEFCALCRELTAGASASPWVTAVAADLQSRAEVLRFVLSGQGPQRRGLVVSGLAAVADGYRAAGSPREVAWTFRRAASFAADGPATGRSRARSLLVQACGEATAGELEVVRANLELMLAELDLRDLLDGTGGHDQKEVLARFDVLADSFRAGGHLFGDALVRWSVARWLLAYGLPDGLDMARAAAADFAAADAPSSELQVWSALQAWYTAHGDPARGREARSRAARLVPGMGFPLAAETRVLDEANEAFRSGDVARARFLLTKKFWAAPNLQAASRLMLATSANAVGLRAEARQLLEGVIDDLTAAGASVLLGEALGLLSTMLTGEDDDRAAALLRQAAGAAQAAESPAEEAKYRAQLAWLIVIQRRSAQVTPLLSEEVAGEFEQAERLLTGQRTLEAGGELVKLYQLRGQAAFLSSDWNQCGSWLTKAETTARGFGLLSDLAFILCYQGLALIEAGRRIGPSAYDQAAGRLEESQRLLRQAELPAFVWQTGFYRALCDIEAARWPQEAAERDARMNRASGLMEESSRLIDQLRESSDRESADLGQRVRMAFSVDKQTFYSQGFHLVWDACSNADAAWLWLERMKGRALLDGLSDGDAPGISLQAEPADAKALATGKPERLRLGPPSSAVSVSRN